MVGPRMRPRFQQVASCAPQEVLSRFHQHFTSPNSTFRGYILDKHVNMYVLQKDQHYWSPHLQVDVYPHAEGSLIRGLFGPHPNVWTMFTAMYAIVVFLTIAAAVFGFSQWTIGQPPTAYWGVPIGVIVLGIIYSFALAGQKMARAQMEDMRTFIDVTLHTHPESGTHMRETALT